MTSMLAAQTAPFYYSIIVVIGEAAFIYWCRTISMTSYYTLQCEDRFVSTSGEFNVVENETQNDHD